MSGKVVHVKQLDAPYNLPYSGNFLRVAIFSRMRDFEVFHVLTFEDRCSAHSLGTKPHSKFHMTLMHQTCIARLCMCFLATWQGRKLKQFEVKHFAVSPQSVKTTKINALEKFLLYGIHGYVAVCACSSGNFYHMDLLKCTVRIHLYNHFTPVNVSTVTVLCSVSI